MQFFFSCSDRNYASSKCNLSRTSIILLKLDSILKFLHWIQQPIPKLQILIFHKFNHIVFAYMPSKTCYNWSKKRVEIKIHSFEIGFLDLDFKVEIKFKVQKQILERNANFHAYI